MQRAPTSVLFPIAMSLALGLLAGCPTRPTTPDPTTDGGATDADAGDVIVTPATGCSVENVQMTPPLAASKLKEGLGAPDFSCHSTPDVFKAIGSTTLEGCVDIFGIGGNARAGLKLAVYGIEQNPQDDTAAYGETDIAVQSQAGPLQAQAAACSKGGYYRIEGVPTHQPLIMKVYEAQTGPTQIAIPSYTYGVVFYDADKDENGSVIYEASLIYKSTYDSIPTLGGKRIDGQQNIYDGEGRAVLAGEVRDCNGNTLGNAVVSSSLLDNNTKVAYFNGNEDDPAPDLSLSSTATDGLFTVLNADTTVGNQHLIVAAILDETCTGDDCQCQAMGAKTIMAFPDSVTLVSFERPYPIIDPNLVEENDAGTPVTDAGVTPVDAGMVVDAGVTPVDAGMTVDAGTTATTDAGTTDAGTLTDAGN